MKVTVVCFGLMRDHLPPGSGGNRAVLDLQSGAPVQSAVRAMGARPEDVFAVLVQGRRADLATELREGDEITLMPPFSGGS